MSLRIFLASVFLLTASVSGVFACEITSQQRRELEIKEGQTIKIAETNLVLHFKEIKKLDSIGCLGGPVGCPVQVTLDVTRENETQQIRLSYLKNKKPVAVKVFDYNFSLLRVQEKQIVLRLTH